MTFGSPSIVWGNELCWWMAAAAGQDDPMPVLCPLADAAGIALGAISRLADRLADRRGLAPPQLALPPEVLEDLRGLFGDAFDPTAVMIRRGHVPGIPHPRAFALPGLIYLGSDAGIVRTDRPRATPTLVHELAHVWQGRHVGPRYVPRAILEQLRLGRRAYDWRRVLDRPAGAACRPGGRGDWPIEAHAQLVSDAYAARYGFAGVAAGPVDARDREAMAAALAGLREGVVAPRPGASV